MILHPDYVKVGSLVALGLDNQEIGDRLGYSKRTIKNMLWRIGLRLSTNGRVQMILRMQALGLLDLKSCAEWFNDQQPMGGSLG